MQSEILKAREERWNKRINIVKEYNKPVVTITLNIPGKEKNNEILEKAFQEIYEGFKKLLLIKHVKILYNEKQVSWDGPEAYIVVDISPIHVKKIAVEFEENYKLGRIADIDVMNPDGKNISRQEVGYKTRKCYLCNNTAHYCTVNKTHRQEQILKKIYSIISEYFEVQNARDI